MPASRLRSSYAITANRYQHVPDELQCHSTYLTEFAQAMDLFVMVGDNLREYRMFIQTNLQAFASSGKADRAGTFTMLRNVNRLLLNFLIMTTTCLDQTATMLNRQFEPNSVELVAFNQACLAEYDSNFAYRFLIRLRNYAAHCGKPVGQLKGSASADRPGGTVAGELRLFLSRDNLLRNFDGWSAVRSEIENLPELFEIDPYVNELVPCLRRIQRLVAATAFPAAPNSADWIDKLATECAGTEGRRLVRISGSDWPPARGQRALVTIADFPFEEVNLVRFLLS